MYTFSMVSWFRFFFVFSASHPDDGYFCTTFFILPTMDTTGLSIQPLDSGSDTELDEFQLSPATTAPRKRGNDTVNTTR